MLNISYRRRIYSTSIRINTRSYINSVESLKFREHSESANKLFSQPNQKDTRLRYLLIGIAIRMLQQRDAALTYCFTSSP